MFKYDKKVRSKTISLIITFSMVFLVFQSLTLSVNELTEFTGLDDDNDYVIWFIDSVITSKQFPIGFNFNQYSELENFTIYTPWNTSSFGSDPKQGYFESPYIFWVELPAEHPQGSGTISININSIPYSNYSIVWDYIPQVVHSPEKIELQYRKYGMWIGSAILSITFFSDLSVAITYEITRSTTLKDHLPYPNDFSFMTTINESEWNEIVDYLIVNDSYNWRSWEFPPEGYNGLIGAICDGGGFDISTKISWNDTESTEYSEEVDNDSCTGERIYTLPVSSTFNTMILEKSYLLIDDYQTSHSTGPSAVITLIITVLMLFTIVYFKRKTL